MIVKMILY